MINDEIYYKLYKDKALESLEIHNFKNFEFYDKVCDYKLSDNGKFKDIIINIVEENLLFYSFLPKYLRDKFSDQLGELKESCIVELENQLTQNPDDYNGIQDDIKEEYKERIEKACVIGWKNLLIENIGFYTYVPKYIREKYTSELGKFEKPYIINLKKQLPKNFQYYFTISKDLKEKYKDVLEKLFIDEFEKEVKEEPFFLHISPEYYYQIPKYIREKYKDKLENALIISLEDILKINPKYYEKIDNDIKEKYPDRLEEACVIGWERILKINLYHTKEIPKHILEKYKERIESAHIIGKEIHENLNKIKKNESVEYKDKLKYFSYYKMYQSVIEEVNKNYISWYKKSKLFER